MDLSNVYIEQYIVHAEICWNKIFFFLFLYTSSNMTMIQPFIHLIKWSDRACEIKTVK
jgi:hypothetical protein